PSGSGKTTVLRMLAGLTVPDAGSIRLDAREIVMTSAEERSFGLVFQSYALFPHLSVRENVEFGLRVRGAKRSARATAAMEVLAPVQLGPLADRRIEQLAGGKKQRVALARAIAHRPRFFLRDEPLSALDAKLREVVRG